MLRGKGSGSSRGAVCNFYGRTKHLNNFVGSHLWLNFLEVSVKIVVTVNAQCNIDGQYKNNGGAPSRPLGRGRLTHTSVAPTLLP